MTSRRTFLQIFAGTTAAGLAGTLPAAPIDSGREKPPGTGSMHPPEPADGQLKQFWNGSVKDLVQLPIPNLAAPQIERHLFYCALLSALVAHYWNGNKRGKGGVYPWRVKQLQNGQYAGGDYLGHNIACLAVDGKGQVIDFDFNHNEIFSSSVEHAESRLVRRIFSLARLNDGWATRAVDSRVSPTSYANLLSDVTIYTSLESCSQCSGIMALGSVKEVVFLQRDDSQNSIGNILRQLSPPNASFKAPLPIPADALGFDHFSRLDSAYSAFTEAVSDKPFFEPTTGTPDKSPSITSFLCTDSALDIFNDVKDHFHVTKVAKFPGFKPATEAGKPIADSLSNQEVLDHAHGFFAYASTEGKRGTPHKL